MSIVIPDDLLAASQMSEAELILEIAVMLYQKGKISGGQARRLTGLNVLEFQQALAQRQVNVNYDVEDFQTDLKTLRSLGRL